MKRKKGCTFKISFILLIVFTQFQNIFSQTPNYFPLAIGNEYQYANLEYPYPPRYSFVKIERDTIYTNGKKYYHLPSPFDFQDCRVDSNGNILSISKPFFGNGDPEEYLLFKANARFGEAWPIAWNFNVVIDTGYARCIYDDSGYVFGKLKKVKDVLIYDESYSYYWFWLAEGIGLVRFRYGDGTICYLNYAKINGVVYGELVSVDEEIHSVPVDITVSQNYPNPFNRSTTIQYQINKSSEVILKVFNILGKEVRELINEYKSAGLYEATWDAKDNFGNELSSGVYFCILTARNLSDNSSRTNTYVKKLILIK